MKKDKEWKRKLSSVNKKKWDEPLTQEEIDILWSSMKEQDDIGERRPDIGCLIVVIGTLVFWSLVSFILSSLL